jgi:hypothetical protein
LWPLAESLALLTGRPASDELEGEAATLAAFRREFGAASRVHRRRAGRLRPVHSAVAGIAAAVFSVGGLAAAAYAGALPPPLQRLAHDIIAAPAPHRRPVSRPASAGPAVRGHSARDLCTLWARVQANGTPAQRAAALTKLATAAGGTDRVAAYCAAVTRAVTPASSQPHPARAPHPSVKPTMVPVPRSPGQPSPPSARHGAGNAGQPPRTGKPARLPTPPGSGQPRGLPSRAA